MGRHNATTATVALAVLVGLGVSACSNDDDSASMSDSTIVMPEAQPGDGSAGESAADVATIGESATSLTSGVDTSGQALATTAGVTVTTPNIRRAVDDTLTAVQRNEASVYHADVNIGCWAS